LDNFLKKTFFQQGP